MGFSPALSFGETHMETAIGVFASRDRAEEAIKELKERLPEESLVFLTRSESEATRVSKEFGKVVGGIAGGATGLYAGIIASLLVPGIGPVFALRAGAAAVLGLAGAGGGSVWARRSHMTRRRLPRRRLRKTSPFSAEF
jgi:hypothetical protein